MKRIIASTVVFFTLINITFSQVFSNQIILSDQIFEAKFVTSSDIDNDGDIDIVALGREKVFLFENLGNTSFSEANQILNLDSPKSLSLSDINNDGFSDLLIGGGWSDDYIEWYPNLGDGTFDNAKQISTTVNGIGQVLAIDLNDDNLKDIIATGYHGDELVWFRNLGNDNFSTKQIIGSNLDGADHIFAGDFNNDNTIDISATSYNDQEIMLFTNNGSGSFSKKIINQIDGYLNFLAGADIDNDGHLDIISNASNGKLAWYKNDGNGEFSENKIGNEYNIGSVYCSDLNNDGHIDISASFYTLDGKISMYKNNGNGEFSDIEDISTNLKKALCVHISDLDNDGDMDMLSASEDDKKIAWYKNSLISSIEDQDNPIEVIISPNPVQDLLSITVENNNFEKLEIFNLIGAKVYSSKNVSSHIDVSNLLKGVYILKLHQGNTSKTTLFIKA